MNTMNTKQIDSLTKILAGDDVGRSATKGKAISRLRRFAEQNDVDLNRMPAAFDAAVVFMQGMVSQPGAPIPAPEKVKEAKPLAVKLDPVKIDDPAPAPSEAPALTVLPEQYNTLKSSGKQQWSGEVDGARIVATFRPMYEVTIERDGVTAEGRAPTYVAAVKAAVADFNERAKR